MNPVVVVEVMSPSNPGDDEGDKRRDVQVDELHDAIVDPDGRSLLP